MKTLDTASRKTLKCITSEELQPLLDHLAACREDTYKRGFWFGVIVTSTLMLAAFVAAAFFGL